LPVIIKQDNLSLTVHFYDGEVFILSDVILTAFDFSTRSFTSSVATLANAHLKAYGGEDKDEELKRYFCGRGWEVSDSNLAGD
jgi:hypothetical protein